MSELIHLTPDNLQALIEQELERDPRLGSQHSRRGYRADLARFEAWRAGRPLSKLLAEQYAAELQAAGRSPAMINRALSALRWWARRLADLAFELPLPRQEREEITLQASRIASVANVEATRIPRGRAIGEGELAALMHACQADRNPAGARDAALIAMAWAAGLRQAEMTGLGLADLRPTEGAGGPTYELLINGKGRKQRRAYLDNGAALALQDWLQLRGGEPGPVFCQVRKGGQILPQAGLSGEAMRLILDARIEQAGVAPLTWHDFRRTFVGDLLEAGEDLATVQQLAGHQDPKTTSQYDRRGEETKKRAARKRFVPYVRRQADPGAGS